MWITWIQHHFMEFQVLLWGSFLFIAWMFFKPKVPKTRFRVREKDIPTHIRKQRAKKAKKRSPLMLTGIRIRGEPHQILDISEDASHEEILFAYRKLMKQYHPDKIAPPGTAPWKEAQNIAIALTEAKNKMIQKKAKKKKTA